MFGWGKTLDVLTLFHAPSKPESIRVLNLLRRATTNAGESALSGKDGLATFQLEVVEEPDVPTADQLRCIVEYAGRDKIGDIVKGAGNVKDAAKTLQEGGSVSSQKLMRPILVDWSNGRAVIGADEKVIAKLIQNLSK